MSIYSANRRNSMSLANVSSNRNYSPVDIGRIMYESQRNDMAIFESILMSDFNEIKKLKEGTLLESEIASLNESSAKDLLDTLKRRLASFWAKIKSAFEMAIRKISAYILRDGKAFAKDFRIQYANAKGKLTSSSNITVKYRNNFKIKIPTADEIESIIRRAKNTSTGVKIHSATIVSAVLSSYVGEKVENPREYMKSISEKTFDDKNVEPSMIEPMLKTIENASTVIKELEASKKQTNNNISRVGKLLRDAEREVESANASTNQNQTEVIQNITMLVSAYETVVSCTTRASIACIKAEVRNYRRALGEVLGTVKNESAIMIESAAIAAEDEVDNAITDVPGEDVDSNIDPETQDAIDNAIDAAGVDTEDITENSRGFYY